MDNIGSYIFTLLALLALLIWLIRNNFFLKKKEIKVEENTNG